MSATTVVTEATFKSTVEKDGIVVIDCWAPWCGPCRAFGPIFDAVAARHPDVTFGKVNTEVEQGLAGALGIQSIPTLMVLRDGVLLYSQPGALPEAALEDLVSRVRALDMDEIRARIAREEAEEAEEAEPAEGRKAS
jgi:thioredoxin 1